MCLDGVPVLGKRSVNVCITTGLPHFTLRNPCKVGSSSQLLLMVKEGKSPQSKRCWGPSGSKLQTLLPATVRFFKKCL